MVVSHTTLRLRLTAGVGIRGFPSSLAFFEVNITLDDVHLDHAFLGGELGCYYPGVKKVPTQLKRFRCASSVNIRPTPLVCWDLSSVCPE